MLKSFYINLCRSLLTDTTTFVKRKKEVVDNVTIITLKKWLKN